MKYMYFPTAFAPNTLNFKKDKPFSSFAVHRGVSQRRHVQQRQRSFQDEICGRRLYRHASRAQPTHECEREER